MQSLANFVLSTLPQVTVLAAVKLTSNNFIEATSEPILALGTSLG